MSDRSMNTTSAVVLLIWTEEMNLIFVDPYIIV